MNFSFRLPVSKDAYHLLNVETISLQHRRILCIGLCSSVMFPSYLFYTLRLWNGHGAAVQLRFACLFGATNMPLLRS